MPWVLTEDGEAKLQSLDEKEQGQGNVSKGKRRIYNRYYHMFEKGELRELVIEAAEELDISVAESRQIIDKAVTRTTLDIIKDDWERSNYYLEFRLRQK